MTDTPTPEPQPPADQPAPPEWHNVWWRELIIAAKYLTRLRIPLSGLPDRAQIGGSLAWFPLIGALVGAFGGLIDGIGIALLHLPATVTSGLAVLGMMWLTRGLHEEQLAALANQYGEMGDRSRRIGWLKEERAVRYGTIAIIFIVILRMSAIASLDSVELVLAALIVSGAWSHALISVAAGWLRPLAGDPVADHFGQPQPVRVLIALGLGAATMLAIMAAGAPLAMLVSSLVAVAVILFASRAMRGYYNGALLGSLQQLSDLAVICAFAAAQTLAE